MSVSDPRVSDDQILAELGYNPELSRSWSGFSNFAISSVPWNPDFEWKFVNSTPLVVGGALLLLWLWELGVHRGVSEHSG